MFWLYLISLIIYIIAFYLRAHKYRTTTTYNISAARIDPDKRKKVSIQMWHIICCGLLFLIPVVNVTSSLGYLFLALPDERDAEFYIFKKSYSSKLFIKIKNFLTKEVWPE